MQRQRTTKATLALTAAGAEPLDLTHHAVILPVTVTVHLTLIASQPHPSSHPSLVSGVRHRGRRYSPHAVVFRVRVMIMVRVRVKVMIRVMGRVMIISRGRVMIMVTVRDT